jgi:excisionase family DNA binding protein
MDLSRGHCLHLGVSKDTVYTWIADKGLPAYRVGRLWKFQASEVDAWVRAGGAAASEPGFQAK